MSGKAKSLKQIDTLTLNRHFLTLNLLSRALAVQAQSLDPEKRNLDRDCGYPEGKISLQQYRDMYDRWGVAARAVQVYPDECWATSPEVYEDENPKKTTRFERAWNDLLDRVPVWHYLHRVDVLSGVGTFGGLLLGFDDGADDLSAPLPGMDERGLPTPDRAERNLIYIRPLSEDYITVDGYDEDKRSPRYGLPKYYTISRGFSATKSDQPLSFSGQVQPAEEFRMRVHWHRFLHVADNLEASDVFGVPRMQRVFNYLFDIRKIGGGSAEMFWQGAFPGYAFEVFKELADQVTLDRESIAEEMEKYRNRIQRVLTSNAGSWKSLAPQIADPSRHIEQQLQLLCASLGVPLRVFLGSEAAHLASTQDIQTWNKRLGRRQGDYLTPRLVRPFVDRLIVAGVLPTPKKYSVSWKDLSSLTDVDKADRAVKLAQTLLQYISCQGNKMIRPVDFLVSFMQFTREEATAMIDAAGGEDAILKGLDEVAEAQLPANNIPKGDPAKKTGASGRRNAQGKGAKK